MRRGATSRGRRKTRLRETHKIITYATLTRKAAANYSPLLFPLLLELEGGEFRLRRDFNAIPSDVCCLRLRLRLETGGVYVEQRFPRDLSEPYFLRRNVDGFTVIESFIHGWVGSGGVR